MSRLFFFVLSLVLIGFLAFKFLGSKKDEGIVLPEIAILDEAGKYEEIVFSVEVAKTVSARVKGLMFRENLPENQGMLFVFEQEAKHWMWMKNTKIPLDILFIDSNERIVEIVANAESGSEKALGGGELSLYVLEVNAGLVEKYGINIGDKIVGLNEI